MGVKEGFPPGYGRRETPQENEGSTKNKKQQQTFEELKNSVTGYEIKGEPLQYNAEGLPDIEEVEADDSLEETVPPPPLPKRKPVTKHVVPPPNKPATPPQPEMPVEKVHPVISRMLETFGLREIKKYNLEIKSPGGITFKYTMTVVPDEAALWALKEGNKKSTTEDQYVGTAWFQLLMASLSIVAIDDTPVWQLFSQKFREPELKDLLKDPLNPSLTIRRICATLLAQMFWSKMVPFADKIYEYYENKIIPDHRVTSSYELEKLNLTRYVCPIDECSIVEFLEPKYDDNGVELDYYCKVHCKPLIRSVSDKLGPLE